MRILQKYRRQNKPNDKVEVYDIVPIFPAQTPETPGNSRLKHDYRRHIAIAIAFRGTNDDIPTLMFAGSGYTLIRKVFTSFLSKQSPLQSFNIYQEHPPVWRNGKTWWRTIVELTDFNSNIIDVNEFVLIVSERLRKECWCEVDLLTLNKFLNI